MPLTPPRLGHPGGPSDQSAEDAPPLRKPSNTFETTQQGLASVHTSTTPQRKSRRAQIQKPALPNPPKQSSKVALKSSSKPGLLAAKSRPERKPANTLIVKELPVPPPLREQQPRKSNIRQLRKIQAPPPPANEDSARPSLASEASSVGGPLRDMMRQMGADPGAYPLIETSPSNCSDALPGTMMGRREPVLSLLQQTTPTGLIPPKDSVFSFGNDTSTEGLPPPLNRLNRLSVQRSTRIDGNLRRELFVAPVNVESGQSHEVHTWIRLPYARPRLRVQKANSFEIAANPIIRCADTENAQPSNDPQSDTFKLTQPSPPCSRTKETEDGGTVSQRDAVPVFGATCPSTTGLPSEAPPGPLHTENDLERSASFNPRIYDIFKRGAPPPSVRTWEGGSVMTDIEPKHEKMLGKLNKESREFIHFCLELKRIACPNALLTDYLARVDRHKVWALMRLRDLLPEFRGRSPQLRVRAVEEAVQTDVILGSTSKGESTSHSSRSIGIQLSPRVAGVDQQPSPLQGRASHGEDLGSKPAPRAEADSSCSPVQTRPRNAASPNLPSSGDVWNTQELKMSTLVEPSEVTPTPPPCSVDISSRRETPIVTNRLSMTPMTSMSDLLYSKPRAVSSDIQDESAETVIASLDTSTLSNPPTVPPPSPPTQLRHVERLNRGIQAGPMSFVGHIFEELKLEHLRNKHRHPHKIKHTGELFLLYSSLCETLDFTGIQIEESCLCNDFGKYTKIFERADWVLRRRVLIAIGKYLQTYLHALADTNKKSFRRSLYIALAQPRQRYLTMARGESIEILEERVKAIADSVRHSQEDLASSVLQAARKYLEAKISKDAQMRIEHSDPTSVRERLLTRLRDKITNTKWTLPDPLQRGTRMDVNEMALASALSKFRGEVVACRLKRLREAEEDELASRLLKLEELERSKILGHSGRFNLSSLIPFSQQGVMYNRTLPWTFQLKIGDGSDLLRPLKAIPADVGATEETGCSPGSVSPQSRMSIGSLALTSPRVLWTPAPLRLSTSGGSEAEYPGTSAGRCSDLSVLSSLNLSELLNLPVTPNKLLLNEDQRRSRVSVVSSIDR